LSFFFFDAVAASGLGASRSARKSALVIGFAARGASAPAPTPPPSPPLSDMAAREEANERLEMRKTKGNEKKSDGDFTKRRDERTLGYPSLPSRLSVFNPWKRRRRPENNSRETSPGSKVCCLCDRGRERLEWREEEQMRLERRKKRLNLDTLSSQHPHFQQPKPRAKQNSDNNKAPQQKKQKDRPRGLQEALRKKGKRKGTKKTTKKTTKTKTTTTTSLSLTTTTKTRPRPRSSAARPTGRPTSSSPRGCWGTSARRSPRWRRTSGSTRSHGLVKI
jgi:hypothetical protein